MTEEATASKVAVLEPQPVYPIARHSQDQTMLAVIERAARDPSVDIDKMERLLSWRDREHERIERERITAAEREFQAAMSEAQAEMEPIRKNSTNPQTRSQYASYDAIDRAIRPSYTQHGFSLSFNTGKDDRENFIVITCKVRHRAGHVELFEVPMPCDGRGAKGGEVMTRTHATGSAITYGKRYLVGMVFNVAIANDDDGNAAGGRSYNHRSMPVQQEAPQPQPKPFPMDPPHDPVTGEIQESACISQDDLAKLIGFADNVGADKIKLCRFLKIESLATLPANRLEEAKTALANYRAKKEADAEEAKRKAQGRRP